MPESFLKVFKKVGPNLQLFRLTTTLDGSNVVRVHRKGLYHYDVKKSAQGNIIPKASNLASYTGPNGLSMRPNTNEHQINTMNWRGDLHVWELAPKIQLPEDLWIVQETADHFTLQPARKMTVEDFQEKANEFYRTKGTLKGREDWLRDFPCATEDAASIRQKSASSSPEPDGSQQ